jgi:ribonuclease Z
MHSTAAMVAKTAADTNLRHLILTHFSQRYRSGNSSKNKHKNQHTVSDLYKEARQLYQGNLLLAEDLQSFQLEKNKRLVKL